MNSSKCGHCGGSGKTFGMPCCHLAVYGKNKGMFDGDEELRCCVCGGKGFVNPTPYMSERRD